LALEIIDSDAGVAPTLDVEQALCHGRPAPLK
jgi:hypothetical protein